MGLRHPALATWLWPLCGALVVLATAYAWRARLRGDAPARVPSWAWPVALFAAYVLGHAGVRGVLAPWPADTTDRLPHVALLGALLALLPIRAAWARLAATGIAGVGAIALVALARFADPTGMSAREWAGLAILWCTFVALVVALDPLSDPVSHSGAPSSPEPPPTRAPLVLGLLTLSLSGTLVFAGSLSLGLLCGAMGSTLALAFFAAWRRPRFADKGAMVPTAALILLALAALAWLYAELPEASLALFAAAPIALFLRRTSWLRARRAVTSSLVEAALVALCAGGGAVLAAQKYFEAPATTHEKTATAQPNSATPAQEPTPHDDPNDVDYAYAE
jgi:hypothetical protein